VDLVDAGPLTVAVHRVFDLRDVRATHELLGTRHVRGKIILTAGRSFSS